MDFKEEFEEIKKDIAENEENKVSKIQPATFEDATKQALAEFKPKYNHDKTMYENGKEIVRTIGLNKALQDDGFIEEVAEGSKKEIRKDMDTDKKKAEIENQKAFYEKHKPVLLFARMKEPGGLALMKWTFGFTIVFYMISLVIGGIGNLIIKAFDCINDLFNSIVGIPQYYTNSNGELVLDENGKPIAKSVKVNLLTKIVFWFGFVILSAVIILAIVKSLTGFDVVQAIRNLVSG